MTDAVKAVTNMTTTTNFYTQPKGCVNFMRYYKIAGAIMALDGFNFDYLIRRMSEYEIPSADTVDITVTFFFGEKVPLPTGEKIAVSNNFREYYTDGKIFSVHDFLSEELGYSAAIISDMETKHARCYLKDIKDFGGAALDIRCFNMLGELFRYFMLNNDGFVLHSSCIDYRGTGIAFSAPSGTGKSTHTGLWKKHYGDAVTIINDDSPAIRIINGKPYVFGTPWSGKTDINTDKTSPLKAIVMLSQEKENTINDIAPLQSVFLVLEEISRPVFEVFFEKLMQHLDKVMSEILVLHLGCTISKDAVDTVKNRLTL